MPLGEEELLGGSVCPAEPLRMLLAHPRILCILLILVVGSCALVVEAVVDVEETGGLGFLPGSGEVRTGELVTVPVAVGAEVEAEVVEASTDAEEALEGGGIAAFASLFSCFCSRGL